MEYKIEMHLTVFKKHLLKEICPVPHLVYNICNPNGLKLLTGLRLGLSHLNEHRFNHNFEDCINPLPLHGFCRPIKMWGLNLKISQNFVGIVWG